MGETLNGYVRRLRLERAALRLSHTGETVTTIALSTGYETPAAFAKAFRQYFGKTPSEYKGAKEAIVRSMMPGVNLTEKEAKSVNPEFRTVPEHLVLFIRNTGPYDKAAAEAWSVLMKFAMSRGLMGGETMAICISHDSPEITPEDKICYDACITIDEDIEPQGDTGIKTVGGVRSGRPEYIGGIHRCDRSAVQSLIYPEVHDQERGKCCRLWRVSGGQMIRQYSAPERWTSGNGLS